MDEELNSWSRYRYTAAKTTPKRRTRESEDMGTPMMVQKKGGTNGEILERRDETSGCINSTRLETLCNQIPLIDRTIITEGVT